MPAVSEAHFDGPLNKPLLAAQQSPRSLTTLARGVYAGTGKYVGLGMQAAATRSLEAANGGYHFT